MDASTVVAIVSVGITFVGLIAASVLRFGKAESSAETAKQALDKAEALTADLAAFKERVARDYATAAMVAAVEGRVVAAIDRLGDRLDRFFEGRVHGDSDRTRP